MTKTNTVGTISESSISCFPYKDIKIHYKKALNDTFCFTITEWDNKNIGNGIIKDNKVTFLQLSITDNPNIIQILLHILLYLKQLEKKI